MADDDDESPNGATQVRLDIADELLERSEDVYPGDPAQKSRVRRLFELGLRVREHERDECDD